MDRKKLTREQLISSINAELQNRCGDCEILPDNLALSVSGETGANWDYQFLPFCLRGGDVVPHCELVLKGVVLAHQHAYDLDVG